MAILITTNKSVKQLKKKNFKNERELQIFIEQNMENLFGIRFIVSEFTTSKHHGGRIDSLGLDENDSPVIIEYKWGEKDNIINQGLFYLDWLIDHQGDFQLLIHKKLGKDIEVDFGSPRVLLIAQTFNKYDQYAINRMAENIELWSYAQYEHNIFELRLIASSQAKITTSSKKQVSKVAYDEYTIEYHIENKNKHVKELFNSLREKIFSLESNQKIEENPRKLYIAYRTNKVFIQIWIQKNVLNIHFKMSKDEFIDSQKHLKKVPPGIQKRSVYCEYTIEKIEDVDIAVSFIEQSYLQSF